MIFFFVDSYCVGVQGFKGLGFRSSRFWVQSSEQIKVSGIRNSEVGMRPPAHRGLRLRPGGNAEKNKKRRRAQGIGQNIAVDGPG